MFTSNRNSSHVDVIRVRNVSSLSKDYKIQIPDKKELTNMWKKSS